MIFGIVSGIVVFSLVVILPYVMAQAGECDNNNDDDGDGLVDWQYDLGCYGPDDPTEGGKNVELDNGWTVFEPASDTQITFISSSVG